MKVSVTSRDFKKTVTLKGNTVADLFRQLKLNPEDYVVSKNSEIVLQDEKLRNNDKVKLFPVISGG